MALGSHGRAPPSHHPLPPPPPPTRAPPPQDTDTLARYKTMHEALVYLAHLDHDDTEAQMLDALRSQLGGRAGPGGPGGGEWSWAPLNTLCWAVGSISGAMAEEQENRFLVTVIRDLLNLCEVTRGKDNKARERMGGWRGGGGSFRI